MSATGSCTRSSSNDLALLSRVARTNGARIMDEPSRDASRIGNVGKQSDGSPMRLTIVEKEVGISRQTMSQVDAGERRATAQVKWDPILASLQEPESALFDDAPVEPATPAVRRSLAARVGRWPRVGDLQEPRPHGARTSEMAAESRPVSTNLRGGREQPDVPRVRLAQQRAEPVATNVRVWIVESRAQDRTVASVHHRK